MPRKARPATVIGLVLVLTVLLSSCTTVSPGLIHGADYIGGVRFRSFANTAEDEIWIGYGSSAKVTRNASWNTNSLGQTEPSTNSFSLSLVDGVLTATVNGASLSRSGFGSVLSYQPGGDQYPEEWSVDIQLKILAGAGTRVEITNLNDPDRGVSYNGTTLPLYAADGGESPFILSITSFSPSFTLSGTIVLYGDFSEGSPDDSRVDFLFLEGDYEVPGPSGRVTVNVVKTDAGSVNGLPVTFAGDLNGTLHTNADGKVELSGLPAGTYTADASGEGYSSDGPKVVVLASDSSQGSATITLTPVPPPPPDPGPGAIHGKVTDGGTGNVLPGALVKLRDPANAVLKMAVSGLDGEFGFEGLEPGSYSVTATLTGYDPALELAQVAHDVTTVVNAVLSGVVVIVEPPMPPAVNPDLPTTGTSYLGILVLGMAAVAVGYGVRRR